MKEFAIMTAAMILALAISGVGKNYLKATEMMVEVERAKLNHEMQEFGASNCHGFKSFTSSTSTGYINCEK